MMFDSLSDRLGQIFSGLTRRGALSEADVSSALREVRRALLEADVALEVVRDFVESVKKKAIGHQVLRSVTPGQQVVKIVHDELIELLGKAGATIDLNAPAPVPIMLVGLQGSGKTTTAAKLAKLLAGKDADKKRILLASLDTQRPAAQEQLRQLGIQLDIPTLPIIAGQTPIQIARRAMEAGKFGGHDVVILDTAGRLAIDVPLMQEMSEIKKVSRPHEILLVADALTGQDAVNVARSFDQQLALTGIILTRMDGDGRGGAALSMRAVTGKPIKLIGVGEKAEAIEPFEPERIARRILGMGDVVALVEKASASLDAEKAEKIAAKMKKGSFDLEDLAEQLVQMRKIGGMSGVLGLLPGIGKMKKQMQSANLDDAVIIHQEAIISSMTPQERRRPEIIKASRKRRIAAGSGTRVEEVNKLLKMHRQMADMMKKMGKRGALSSLFGGASPSLDPGGLPPSSGALPPGPSIGGLPGGLPGLPGSGMGIPTDAEALLRGLSKRSGKKRR